MLKGDAKLFEFLCRFILTDGNYRQAAAVKIDAA